MFPISGIHVETYTDALKACLANDDPAFAHPEADDVLRKLLLELGYSEVVELYDKVEKWYE